MSEEMAMLQSPAPHTLPSTPFLIQRLVDEFSAVWVNEANLEEFAAEPGDKVIFVAGDPIRFPECLDVAVVLPELQKTFEQRFRIAVAQSASEDAIARKYDAQRRPALIFLRDALFVTVVSGMLDWDIYLDEVGKALAMPAGPVPRLRIPIMSQGSDSGCH